MCQMIELAESGYTLRQVRGTRITFVTFPDGSITDVIGPWLSRATAKAIILAAGKSYQP